jgi:hypothetical protein
VALAVVRFTNKLARFTQVMHDRSDAEQVCHTAAWAVRVAVA